VEINRVSKSVVPGKTLFEQIEAVFDTNLFPVNKKTLLISTVAFRQGVDVKPALPFQHSILNRSGWNLVFTGPASNNVGSIFGKTKGVELRRKMQTDSGFTRSLHRYLGVFGPGLQLDLIPSRIDTAIDSLH
jgi:hypothetical protein